MLTKHIRLSLPANSENLTLIRQLVEKLIEGTPFADRSYEIQLVMSEACTNVIRHAYDDRQSSKLITIHGSMSPLSLRLSVRDTGNGLTKQTQELEFPGDGGYGIALMRNLSDRFSLKAIPGAGTTVHFVFDRRLMPQAIRRQKSMLVATALFALLMGLIYKGFVAYSLPGASLYDFRNFSETLVVGLPLDSKLKLDVALAFAERHLDDYERSYSEGNYEDMEEPLTALSERLDVVGREFRKLPVFEQYCYSRNLKKLYNRLLVLSKRITVDSQVFSESRSELGKVVNTTGKILAGPVKAGERI